MPAMLRSTVPPRLMRQPIRMASKQSAGPDVLEELSSVVAAEPRVSPTDEEVSNLAKIFSVNETTYTYTPSDARAARALCFDDVRAERAPRVRGVHGGLRGMLGVHVAHFRPMCLTARNSPRHPTSPITSRTGPTGFDVRS